MKDLLIDHKEGTMVVMGIVTNEGIMAEVEVATRIELMKPKCEYRVGCRKLDAISRL